MVFGVRISGQDSGRGTFFHRHAVLHDQNRERWNEGTYVPLRHITPEQPDFVIIDSVLSEEAVLGFEYGYATAEPDELVVWEAQFGDFANGAQVVIDQFIASGEAKWGRLCGLVMMLPHGYEGQGPEHSSARLERYLQLCAEYNIQVCVPSTPAQMFHVLRRQMIRPLRKPLIIMSPKSLLRHKESISSLEDLADGSFQTVIPEAEKLDPENVRRVVACCGKVYYDLLAYRREHQIEDVAIIRIEQLYPFPHDDFQAEVERYPQARDILWCQEEPGNQGAWHRIQHYLLRHKRPGPGFGLRIACHPRHPRRWGTWQSTILQQKELVQRRFARKFNQEDGRHARRSQSPDVIRVGGGSHPAFLAQKEGEHVDRDENLIDIETDKVVLELPAPATGVLAKIIKGDGATVTSGEVIATIDTEAHGACNHRLNHALRTATAAEPASASPAPSSAEPAPKPAASVATRSPGDDARRPKSGGTGKS